MILDLIKQAKCQLVSYLILVKNTNTIVAYIDSFSGTISWGAKHADTILSYV